VKLSSIINEELIKRLHALTQKVVDKFNQFANTDVFTVRKVSYFIELITTNPNYQEWLLRQSLANPEYFTTVDQNDLIKLLADFLNFQHQLPNPNINHYTVQELAKEIDEIYQAQIGLPRLPNTRLRIKDPQELPGVTLEATEGSIKAYKVTDPNSLAELGEGSKWCTRKSYPNCRAATYLQQSAQIILVYKDRLIAQFAEDLSEIKNLENESLEPEVLAKLLPPSYIDKKINDTFEALGQEKNEDFQSLSYMDRTILAEKMLNYGMMKEQADQRILDLIRQWPQKLVKYKVHHNLEIPSRELKYLMQTDPARAVKIASLLNVPTPDIEKEMLYDLMTAARQPDYAESVKLYYKKNPQRLNQAKLLTLEMGVPIATRFACEILKRPWPELEAMLATSIVNTQRFTKYAIQAVRARSIEYEQYIEKQLQEINLFNYHDMFLRTISAATDYISALNIKNWTKPLELLKQSKQDLIQRWQKAVEKNPAMKDLEIVDRIVKEASEAEDQYEQIIAYHGLF